MKSNFRKGWDWWDRMTDDIYDFGLKITFLRDDINERPLFWKIRFFKLENQWKILKSNKTPSLT
jgi:hypothetical protein